MSIVLYTDCNLGKNIFPGVLRAAGLYVQCHFDHFPGDAPDELWIPHVAQQGWYALTNDRRIYQNRVQRELVLRSGLGLFVLPAGHVVIKELADNFVLTFPKVERFVARHSGAFIASVTRSTSAGKPGSVNLLHPKKKKR